MKKSYHKPVMREICLTANQAIAACSLTGSGYQLSDSWASTFYPTFQAALDAQPDPASATADIVFPVYTYRCDIDHGTWTESLSGMWADTNKNGNMDDSDIVYNQQGNRPNIQGLANVMNS